MAGPAVAVRKRINLLVHAALLVSWLPLFIRKRLLLESVYDRRAREIPAEVKTLKAQLPKPVEGQESPSSPLTGQIAALEQARRYCQQGSWPSGLASCHQCMLPCICFIATSQRHSVLAAKVCRVCKGRPCM